MKDSSGELARHLKKGSRDAWAKLYDTYAKRVWRLVAWRLTNNTSEVGDVVQEIFMTAAKSAHQFDPKRGTVWDWLSGITRNQVALKQRKDTGRLEQARKWWARQDGDARKWVEGSDDGPDKVIQAKEMAVLVAMAMGELSDDYQELLTSRYFQGKSAVAIAQKTGANAEAVRAKLMRARRAFRKVFLEMAGENVETIGEVLQ